MVCWNPAIIKITFARKMIARIIVIPFFKGLVSLKKFRFILSRLIYKKTITGASTAIKTIRAILTITILLFCFFKWYCFIYRTIIVIIAIGINSYPTKIAILLFTPKVNRKKFKKKPITKINNPPFSSGRRNLRFGSSMLSTFL